MGNQKKAGYPFLKIKNCSNNFAKNTDRIKRKKYFQLR
jgi:hypothetical protein